MLAITTATQGAQVHLGTHFLTCHEERRLGMGGTQSPFFLNMLPRKALSCPAMCHTRLGRASSAETAGQLLPEQPKECCKHQQKAQLSLRGRQAPAQSPECREGRQKERSLQICGLNYFVSYLSNKISPENYLSLD